MKEWYKSKTIWGALGVVAATIGGQVGGTVGSPEEAELANQIATVGQILGAIITIWGRKNATQPIGKPPTNALILAIGLCLGFLSHESAAQTDLPKGKIRYIWTTAAPNAETKSPIVGYQLFRSTQTVPTSIAGHIRELTVDVPLDANGCISETAYIVARAQDGFSSPNSNEVSVKACPPSKVELRWEVTVQLSPTAPAR